MMSLFLQFCIVVFVIGSVVKFKQYSARINEYICLFIWSFCIISSTAQAYSNLQQYGYTTFNDIFMFGCILFICLFGTLFTINQIRKIYVIQFMKDFSQFLTEALEEYINKIDKN